MKKLFFYFFLFFFGTCVAQTTDRVEVLGNIKVPADSEAEGITVYNKNSGHGTVSSEKGDFSLFVKSGDSLYFSAVQYGELLVVVDEEAVTTERLNVEINQGVNQLPEVVVRPHNLTGNLKTDAENIEVVQIELPPMSFNVNDYEMRPDKHSKVANSALGEKSGPSTAINIFAIAAKIGSLIFPKKTKPEKSGPEYTLDVIEMDRILRDRYEKSFFEGELQIPGNEIGVFIEFINENGLPDELLKKEKEMDLIGFLFAQSHKYRQIQGE